MSTLNAADIVYVLCVLLSGVLLGLLIAVHFRRRRSFPNAMGDAVCSEEFDHICYAYRTAPLANVDAVAQAFDAIKLFVIRKAIEANA